MAKQRKTGVKRGSASAATMKRGGASGGGMALGANNYGKSRVRLVKVSRDTRSRPARHTVVEVGVDISLEGTFERVHTCGDNALCLPTDTMKNTVYALGKDHPLESVEEFAAYLGRHFVSRNRQVRSARVRVSRTPWERVSVRGREHPHCFTKGTGERAWCEARVGRAGVEIESGIEDLVILKSTDSAFSGYPRDEFTTLAETRDRIFATSLTARWGYAGKAARATSAEFERRRARVRAALIETFAAHKSESVQHTLYAMGEAALGACPSTDSIRLSMPNKHCLLVNLAPFKRENHNEIFVPTDEPYGLIEGTVRRRTR